MTIPPDQLDIPLALYLDTNVLMDVLASLRGGYSTMERVVDEYSKAAGSNKQASVGGGATFGIGSIISFFRVSESTSDDKVQRRESEKYHTVGSLLHELRQELKLRGALKDLTSSDDWSSVSPSDFVEIEGIFRRNPLVTSIEATSDAIRMYRSMLPIVAAFEETPSAQDQSQQKSKKKSQKSKAKTRDSPVEAQMNAVQNWLKDFLHDDSTESPIVHIVQTSLNVGLDEVTATVSLYPSYLRDRAGIELTDGRFRVLGKVARKVKGEDRIDLLAGTQVKGLNPDAFDMLMPMFKAMDSVAEIPEFERYIPAPALVVIPIAVFV